MYYRSTSTIDLLASPISAELHSAATPNRATSSSDASRAAGAPAATLVHAAAADDAHAAATVAVDRELAASVPAKRPHEAWVAKWPAPCFSCGRMLEGQDVARWDGSLQQWVCPKEAARECEAAAAELRNGAGRGKRTKRAPPPAAVAAAAAAAKSGALRR